MESVAHGTCRFPTAVVVGIGSVMFGGWSDGMGGNMSVFTVSSSLSSTRSTPVMWLSSIRLK